MLIALAQMPSQADLATNLRRMEKYTAQAARRKARLIAFPEMAYFSGPREDAKASSALFPALHAFFSGLARKYNVGLLPGSVREPGRGRKFFNTALAFDAQGREIARYRKIHLFEATLPDRKYQEARDAAAGDAPCMFEFEDLRVGLAICFDLRFAELFRALRAEGADLVLVPSAFTVPTGKAHWEVLLRARAIENQVYLGAPALVGTSGSGAEHYGDTLAVDPWGKVLGRRKKGAGLVFFRYDPTFVKICRKQIDCGKSRRHDVFP